MSSLRDVHQTRIDNWTVAGVVDPVATRYSIELEAAGDADVNGTALTTGDSIVRIASMTKPITPAALMKLTDGGGSRWTTRSVAGYLSWRRGRARTLVSPIDG